MFSVVWQLWKPGYILDRASNILYVFAESYLPDDVAFNRREHAEGEKCHKRADNSVQQKVVWQKR